MNHLDQDYRAGKNGMIDYDHYRALAAHMRREARSDALRGFFAAFRGALKTLPAYLRLPQNRWMRRQASSKSSVFVA